MYGYRKLIYGLSVVALATCLLAFHLISDEIWERVICWASAFVIGGNVLSNAVGSLSTAFSIRKESVK